MERDQKISKLFRESGLAHTTGNFTDQVMDQIRIVPEKKAYKPLIGRNGQILIVLFIIGIVLLSVFYSEPGGGIFENIRGLSNVEWKLPQINFSWGFLTEINFSTWLVSTIVALFLLVLSDAGLKRRRRLV